MKKTDIFLLSYFIFIIPCNTALALPVSYLTPTYNDQDKYHILGNWDSWTQNWYNDSSGNGRPGTNDVPNPASNFAESADPTWSNPDYYDDLSCWLASASNMLEYYPDTGAAPSTIYAELLGYGNGFYWWQGGLTDIALSEYMTRNNLSGHYYITDYNGFVSLWPNNIYDIVRESLITGSTVSLGIWNPSDMTMGHAITLWGWNNNGIIFTDSDQDYTSVSNLDLQYADVTFSGGEWYIQYPLVGLGTTEERWVNYAAILSPVPVPEPSTMLLLGAGLVGLARFRRRLRK